MDWLGLIGDIDHRLVSLESGALVILPQFHV